MQDIKTFIKDSRSQEIDEALNSALRSIAAEGLMVEFGAIGEHTTYAMIYDVDHETEIVGYTYIQNLKYYKENVGKLKALQQAIARKETARNRE